MKFSIDGNAYCITEDDFINLVESPAEFVVVDSLVGKLISQLRQELAAERGKRCADCRC